MEKKSKEIESLYSSFGAEEAMFGTIAGINPRDYVPPEKILWLSRHGATLEQKNELEQSFGEVEIIQVSTTVKSANEIKNLMEEHDAKEVVTVLPLDLLAELTRMGIHPIRAVMERKIEEGGEVTFSHKFFEKITRVEVDSHPLSEEGK